MRKIVTYSIVFVMGFCICALAMHAIYGADYTLTSDVSKQVVLAALTKPVPPIAAGPGESIIADAAAKIEPSVVTIDTESKPVETSNPFTNDPFFRNFFGGGGGSGAPVQPSMGAASGVIISPDGYILTNNHVVANTDSVKVNLADGKQYSAKVIGSDPTSDIAVVKINAPGETLAAAELGDSTTARVGDMVIAVGNPLDVGTTVTFGIVSALGHRNGQLTAGPHPLASNIIQTDAAINPGNSGGALADMNGRVVGINEAILSPNGESVGIGFAIPINTAKDIAAQLIATGKVTRSYVGIEYGPLKGIDVDSRQQVGINLKGDDGDVITQVFPDSPAAAAGLKEYDVILEANRIPITDSTNLADMISKLKPGDKLVLKIYRNGSDLLVPVTVAQMPANFGSSQDNSDSNAPDDGQGGDQGNAPIPVNPFGQ
jgi:S1-C subfamily serine protease